MSRPPLAFGVSIILDPAVHDLRRLGLDRRIGQNRPAAPPPCLAVLVVEQHAHAVLGVADRACVMDLGRTVHQGTARSRPTTTPSPPAIWARLPHERATVRGQKLVKEDRRRRLGSPPFLGLNGSGKTTLFELITGSNRPTEGPVL
jgi:energy-coupling factor transporter ATP-binding protein EcfA2